METKLRTENKMGTMPDVYKRQGIGLPVSPGSGQPGGMAVCPECGGSDLVLPGAGPDRGVCHCHDSLKGLQEKHFSVKLPRFLAIRILNNPGI